MGYHELLIQTAQVSRYTAGAADAYGVPLKSWVVRLNAVPCRVSNSGGREIKVGAEVVIADYQLFFEDEDVTEQDRAVIDGLTYEILLVERPEDNVNGHHKECMVRIVR